MDLSKHITLDDALKSEFAELHDIDNSIPEDDKDEVVKNLEILANNICDPIIEKFGKDKVDLTSIYRCKDLDALLSSNIDKPSDHNRGMAVNIKGKDGLDNRELAKFIIDEIPFTEFIWVGRSDYRPYLIYISFSGNVSKSIKKISFPGATPIEYDPDFT